MKSEVSGKERIIAAAIRCFGEYGIAGTSMQVIAGEAETSQALIVHHFGSKQALADHCTAVVFSRADALVQADPELAVEAFATRSADIRYIARILTDNAEASRGLFAAAVERAASARQDIDGDEAVVLAVFNLAPILLLDRITEALPKDTWARFTRATSRLLISDSEEAQ